MSVKNELSRLTIDIPREEHRKLKSLAALLGKSMREVILESIKMSRECLASEHIPNAETRKSLENIEKRKNLTVVHDIEDLLTKLNK